jgi:hypothetical protein
MGSSWSAAAVCQAKDRSILCCARRVARGRRAHPKPSAQPLKDTRVSATRTEAPFECAVSQLRQQGGERMSRDVGSRVRPRDGAACMSCFAVGSVGVSLRVRGSVPGRRRSWRSWRRTCHSQHVVDRLDGQCSARTRRVSTALERESARILSSRRSGSLLIMTSHGHSWSMDKVRGGTCSSRSLRSGYVRRRGHHHSTNCSGPTRL